MPTGTPAPLQRGASQPLAGQLAERYAQRIRERLLPPGARLPSVRDCARQHGVSPHTVVAAYDQLQAAGLLEARRQRGFFVREAPAAARRAPAAAAPTQPIDATALIRGMFRCSGPPAPGSGMLPAEWLDLPLLHGALRRALSRDDDSALHYGDPAGDARLRQSLSSRLADLGVRAAPEQIVTTSGATHALDIVARALLQPGDAVLVDEPGWAVEYARLTRLGLKLLPVPRGPAGPDLDAMRALLAAHAPRMYVTVSVLHNPTGSTLPLAAAHQVLKLAEAHDFTVAEDDTYAHLAPAHAPRMAALDDLQRTVYVSGFSKILVPNWRVGYIAAPTKWVDRFVDCKLLGTLGTPTCTERAVALLLEQGVLRRHAERVVARLAAARLRVQRLAADAGCRFVTPPNGLFGWIDAGCDTERLAHAMLDDSWLLAPGRLFLVEPRPTPWMRINFATTQDAGFWKALTQTRSGL